MPPSCRGVALLVGWSCLVATGCQGPEQLLVPAGGKGVTPGLGVVLKQGATTYFGNPYNCSRPAAIDLEKVQATTPEWQTITTDRVRRGSARYQLLQRQMHERIVAAIAQVARARNLDLVVRIGDIQDSREMTVTDITVDVEGALDPARKVGYPSAFWALPEGWSWGLYFGAASSIMAPAPTRPRATVPANPSNP